MYVWMYRVLHNDERWVRRIFCLIWDIAICSCLLHLSFTLELQSKGGVKWEKKKKIRKEWTSYWIKKRLTGSSMYVLPISFYFIMHGHTNLFTSPQRRFSKLSAINNILLLIFMRWTTWSVSAMVISFPQYFKFGACIKN